jgi:hypothetical protein
MTTSAEQAEKVADKEALKARAVEMEAEEKKLNAGKTGVGTRTFLGMTRGRNPQKIQYEAFDDSQPETLPKTLSEFMTITSTDDEKVIMAYVLDGFNSASYTAASDPVSEFVEATWPDDVKKQFRIVVKNYANATQTSIEDAVALIKPGIVKSQAK